MSTRGRAPLWVKLLAGCVLLVSAPLLATWALGLYDAAEIDESEAALERLAASRLTPGERRALAPGSQIWLREVDASGAVTWSSPPEQGVYRVLDEGLGGWVADAFFGPDGPSDLASFDAGLPPIAERPEVRAALGGHADSSMRSTPSGDLYVHALAVPAEGGGALYLVRGSRRSARALYERRYGLLKLTLVLVGVAVAVGLWLALSVVGPLTRLQRRVRRYLDTGAGSSLALDRADEVGELSRDFDRLVARLSARAQDNVAASADLAHDLKNPIATVTASAELLEGEQLLDADRRARLARALAAAGAHMERSVNAMLDLAALREALWTAPRAPIDLGAWLRQEELPAAVELDVRGSAWVLAAPSQLRVAVRNLVDNAVDFAASKVRLTLEVADGWARLTVEDDGPGVSAGNRDKVFQRFFSHRPDGAPRGHGLGLAIAREVVEAHGGRVELETEAPAGARFVVALPEVGEGGGEG